MLASTRDVMGHRAGWGKCPGYSDRDPSLSIGIGRDGRVLLNCFAGCTLSAILKAAGLRMPDLFPKGRALSPAELRRAEDEREQRDTYRQRERKRDGKQGYAGTVDTAAR
jgi:hypothetical protein